MRIDSLVEKVKNADGMDEAIGLLMSFQTEVTKFSDEDKTLESVVELDETKQKEAITGLIAFAKQYDPEATIVGQLETLLKLSGPALKEGIVALIAKLKAAKTAVTAEKAPVGTQDPPIKSVETVNMFNQEIAAPGDYGEKGAMTEADLIQISKNWSELKDQIKPPLKLGHSEGFVGDGKPASGWVTNLRVAGSKLLADFTDVPAKLAEFIRMKHYRRISPEIYMDYTDEQGLKHGKVLRAVALLGADVPEMKTLKDLEVLYSSEELTGVNILLGSVGKGPEDKGGVTMTAEELKAIQAKQGTLMGKYMELEINKFLEENKGKVLPMFEPILRSLLTATFENTSTLKFAEGGVEKEVSIHSAVRELITHLPSMVEFAEKAKQTPGVEEADAEYAKVQKYAEDNKVSFAEARRSLGVGNTSKEQ